MGLKKDTKKTELFYYSRFVPGPYCDLVSRLVSSKKKYRDLYFRKWVLDVESDFPLNGWIVSREKIWPIFKGHADIRRSILGEIQ